MACPEESVRIASIAHPYTDLVNGQICLTLSLSIHYRYEFENNNLAGSDVCIHARFNMLSKWPQSVSISASRTVHKLSRGRQRCPKLAVQFLIRGFTVAPIFTYRNSKSSKLGGANSKTYLREYASMVNLLPNAPGSRLLNMVGDRTDIFAALRVAQHNLH